MKDFKEKIVVITGAGSGMGRAYAEAFAREGSFLALCDIDKKGLEETIKSVRQKCSKVISKTFDISNESETNNFAKQVKEELGDCHVLINNAGIEGSTKPVWDSPNSYFRKVMDVNYFGVVNGTRAFIPQLREKNRGVIVNVSSVFGLVGTPNHADYCASKFAVRGFTEALMVELYASNIQVHILHPGGIDTNIARKESSHAFSTKFLTTKSEAVAQHLIKCIRKNKIRIVYGNNAYKTWLGVRLMPLKWLRRIIWLEMKSVIETKKY